MSLVSNSFFKHTGMKFNVLLVAIVSFIAITVNAEPKVYQIQQNKCLSENLSHADLFIRTICAWISKTEYPAVNGIYRVLYEYSKQI